MCKFTGKIAKKKSIKLINFMKKWCKKDSGAKKILSGKVIFKGVASSMRERLLIFALAVVFAGNSDFILKWWCMG